MRLNRRAFLKLALLTSGVAAAGYFTSDLFNMTNASIQSLASETSAAVTIPMNDDWKIPHLLRRASFGGSTEEISTFEGLGVNGAINQLLNYQNVDTSGLPSQPNISMAFTRTPSQSDLVNLVWWWIDRMTRSPRPLEERMALFWHNHFATAIYKVRSPYLMFKQNELLRSKGTGRFRDLLMGITEDPAMLIWLDGALNRKGAPNENYGREVMEVFTIGLGNYTEDDVKSAARAFTGYRIDKSGNSFFNPKLHDEGTKTFLGQTGNFGPQDIVEILSTHPETANSIARKLFAYFAYDGASNETIDRLANVYMSTDGNIGAVVEAILKSDEFWSAQAHLNLVKGPVDYVTTALRSLGASVNPKSVVGLLNNMGQLPFDPPSVFGWPSGVAWVNTSTVLTRTNFPLLIQSPANTTFDGTSVDAVTRVLFPEGLPSNVLQVIQQSTDSLSNQTQKLRNIIRLTMASPFYNLN
jgi:uncharacterized protein (DUF1800 family)